MSAPARVAPEAAAATATVTHRVNVRFTPDAALACCLATDERGTSALELWSLRRTGPVLCHREPTGADANSTLALPVPGGRMLVIGYEPAAQTFDLISTGGQRRRLGRTCVGANGAGNLRLVAAPRLPGVLALGVRAHADGSSTVYRISEGPRWAEPVVTVAGPLAGPTVVGNRALFTRLGPGGRVPMLLDVRSGEVCPLRLPDGYGAGLVLPCGGDTVLLGLPVDAGHRLALVDPAGAGAARLLPEAGDLGGPVTPVAVDPGGTRVALVVAAGARSRLAIADAGSGEVSEVDLPMASLVPSAGWSAQGMWLVGSTPTRPPGFARLSPGAGHGSGQLSWAEPDGDWHPGRVESFPGPAGPIETIGYGPDWHTARRVVLVLHGGPREHWRSGFERSFQSLVDAGITVLAPNQRGSTGYGPAHELAIAGAWGGPDLADIEAIGRTVDAARGPGRDRPALLGTSYGAYLALLAAAAAPGLWSRCVAVAPFLSAQRLYPGAARGVRALIDRLDGRQPVTDALGPRDLVRLAPALTLPLLVAHGALDQTVPVSHSRELVDELVRIGDRGRPAPVYLEMSDRGHAAVGEHPDDHAMSAVLRFLTTSDEGRR